MKLKTKKIKDDVDISFDWENLCFIGSKSENRKKNISSDVKKIKCEKSSELFSRLN